MNGLGVINGCLSSLTAKNRTRGEVKGEKRFVMYYLAMCPAGTAVPQSCDNGGVKRSGSPSVAPPAPRNPPPPPPPPLPPVQQSLLPQPRRTRPVVRPSSSSGAARHRLTSSKSHFDSEFVRALRERMHKATASHRPTTNNNSNDGDGDGMQSYHFVSPRERLPRYMIMQSARRCALCTQQFDSQLPVTVSMKSVLEAKSILHNGSSSSSAAITSSSCPASVLYSAARVCRYCAQFFGLYLDSSLRTFDRTESAMDTIVEYNDNNSSVGARRISASRSRDTVRSSEPTTQRRPESVDASLQRRKGTDDDVHPPQRRFVPVGKSVSYPLRSDPAAAIVYPHARRSKAVTTTTEEELKNRDGLSNRIHGSSAAQWIEASESKTVRPESPWSDITKMLADRSAKNSAAAANVRRRRKEAEEEALRDADLRLSRLRLATTQPRQSHNKTEQQETATQLPDTQIKQQQQQSSSSTVQVKSLDILLIISQACKGGLSLPQCSTIYATKNFAESFGTSALHSSETKILRDSEISSDEISQMIVGAKKKSAAIFIVFMGHAEHRASDVNDAELLLPSHHVLRVSDLLAAVSAEGVPTVIILDVAAPISVSVRGVTAPVTIFMPRKRCSHGFMISSFMHGFTDLCTTFGLVANDGGKNNGSNDNANDVKSAVAVVRSSSSHKVLIVNSALRRRWSGSATPLRTSLSSGSWSAIIVDAVPAHALMAIVLQAPSNMPEVKQKQVCDAVRRWCRCSVISEVDLRCTALGPVVVAAVKFDDAVSFKNAFENSEVRAVAGVPIRRVGWLNEADVSKVLPGAMDAIFATVEAQDAMQLSILDIRVNE